MIECKIETRLAGHPNQYHTLKVLKDGVPTGQVHTSKSLGYILAKAAEIKKFS